jgi:predicted DCC family thiol-disulfide oxidoreductase YuxK
VSVDESVDAASLPLLIFDGDCGFCTTSATAGKRWLKLDNVEPWQMVDLEQFGLTAQQCQTEVKWVDVSGRAVGGANAVIATLRYRGGVWGLIGRLLALPGLHWFSGVVYRLVARYRYRLPGGTPACKVPSAR